MNKKIIITGLVLTLIILFIFTVYLLAYESIKTIIKIENVNKEPFTCALNPNNNNSVSCNNNMNCFYVNGSCLDSNVLATSNISSTELSCTYQPIFNDSGNISSNTLNCYNTNNNDNSMYLITTLATSKDCQNNDPSCNLLLPKNVSSTDNLKKYTIGIKNVMQPPVSLSTTYNQLWLTDINGNQNNIKPVIKEIKIGDSNIPVMSPNADTIMQLKNNLTLTNNNLSRITN
jgi:hypothetical protein